MVCLPLIERGRGFILLFILFLIGTSMNAVGQAPVAAFSVSQGQGCVPLSISFTNTSQNAVSWYWDFGNGNFSTSEHPYNVYLNTGSYTVKLVVYNSSGQADSVVYQNLIQTVQPPSVNFTASSTIQCLGSGVINFTNQSSLYDACMWDFGDGSTSSATNPSHQYNSPGIYTITLIAYNSSLGCTTSLSKPAYVQVLSSPLTTFTASHTSLCEIQTPVVFTPQSSSANSWFWMFGDGGTSTQQTPSHNYSQSGVYDVTLITSNVLGCADTTIMPSYIHVLDNPVPTITSTGQLSKCVPVNSAFSTSVPNVTSYAWDFGDTTYAQIAAPFHSYLNPGNYVVSLKVTYANGCVNEDTVHVNAWPKSYALYSLTPSTGCAPLSVNFLNGTSGSGNQYTWNFGDGTTSNATAPVHIYNNTGQYTTSLQVANQYGCVTNYSFNVMVNVIQPSALFTADDIAGCPPHQVNFNHPGGGVYTYQWNFGDGSTSNQQSPSHTYQTAGNYSVSLSITEASGCVSTYTLPSMVQVSNGVNNFNPASPVVACAPFTVNLNDNSPGAISWDWDFGDGNSSTVQNPVHTYTVPGTYQVGLQTQSGGNGCSQSVMPYSTYIINGGEADFTLTQTICPPFTATFTDQSTNAVSWLWDFGDGNTSTQQHPVHVYAVPGNYNVTLTITTADGCVYTKYHNYAASFLPLIANATATSPDSILPITVTFNANSSGATQWLWDFGDGGTSTLQNPVHIYTVPGPYNISLTISNPGCTFTYYYNSVTLGAGGVLPGSNNDSVPVPPPLYSCIPYQMNFSNPAQNTVSWLWDFGDGNSSIDQNPIHIYTDPGVYTVTLITWDSSGVTDTIVQAAPFYLTGSTADFNLIQSNNCQGSTLQTQNNSVNAVSYLWDFGDGTTSTAFEPTHTYSTTGINYIISLTVTDSLGCTDFMSRSYYAGSSMPLSAGSRRGCAGDTINFYSGGLVFSSYLWNFGNGVTSTASNPFYAYPDSGSFQVSLTVTDTSGCSFTWQLPYLITINKPVASFTYQVFSSGCTPPTVEFTNTSTGATSYLWNFGYNQFSTQINPVKTFSMPGQHNVTLTVSSDGCYDSVTLNNFIYVPWLRVNFNYTQASDCYPVSVAYADSSIDAVSWLWDFGDGTTSTLQNPVHTFNSKPQGSVTLTVTSATGCVLSKSKPNIVAVDVLASVNATSGCSPHQLMVSDSSDNVASWLWDFGDGNTSATQTPVHLYTQNGIYNVSLTVTSPSGCQQIINPVATIKVTGPQAQFTQNTIVSCAPTIVNFYDNSSGATSWNWSFGNGNHSVLENPVHVYNQPGTYDVTLIVTDSLGCTDSLTRPQLVHITGSVSSFAIQSTSGCSPWQIQFADSSISAFSWLWNFGDGNISTQQNPQHTYVTPGNYQVTLITQDTTGCQSVYTSPVPLQVQQPPIASFTSVNNSGCAPLTVNFINSSTGAVSYQWNFGDGTTSSVVSPSHVFTNPGLYFVSLVVFNVDGCSDTLIAENPVVVGTYPVPSFTISNIQGCSPMQVQFTNNTTNTDSTTIYQWQFGNGGTSSAANPSIIYTQPGIYSVTLTATNNSVCSAVYTLNQSIAVADGTAPDPVLLKSVSVADSNNIEVTWGNLPIQTLQTYNLYRFNDITMGYDLVYTDLTPSNTSIYLTSNYADTTVLTSDKTYTYVVQAVNNCLSGTPLSLLEPHTSINLKVSTSGGAGVLDWNFYDGCAVDGYQIFRQDLPSGSFNHLGTVNSSTNTYTDSTVYCGLNVRYVVKAFNLCGEGYEAWSDEESIFVPGILEQQKVDMVRSTVVDDAYVFTEWSPPALAPQMVTGFELYKSTDNINFTLLGTMAPGEISYSDYDVNVKSQYYFYKIKVNNVCGIETSQGLESSSILLIGSLDGDGQTLLRWSPYKSWNTGVDYYVIERLDDSGLWQTLRVVGGNVLELIDR